MIRLNLFILLLLSFGCIANSTSILVLAANASPIENMVVYLTPQKAINNNNIKTKSLIINQKNKQFVPYIEVAQKGQNISFHNNDDITHHIYSVSGKNRFDFKIQGNHVKESPNLNSVGEVAMGCNIHDWMSGYVLVVDTPFFTKTNKQGMATFANLPAGKYELTLWHPQLDVVKNKIIKNITLPNTKTWQIKLTKKLLPLPSQESDEDFDFLEGY